MGKPFINYELVPKLNDYNLEFKVNVDLFNVSEMLLWHAVKKMVYPKVISITLPNVKRKYKKPAL